MKSPKLIRDVLNFVHNREAIVTIIDATGREITTHAKDIFSNKNLLKSFSAEDANRISYLAAFEHFG